MQPPTEVILRRQSFRRDNDAPSLGNGAGNEAHQPYGDEVQQRALELAGPSAAISAKAGADLAAGRGAARRNGSAAQPDAAAKDAPQRGDPVLAPASRSSTPAEAAAADDSSAPPYFDATASLDGQ